MTPQEYERIAAEVMATYTQAPSMQSPCYIASLQAAERVLSILRAHVKEVDVEAVAIACSQWQHGKDCGYPRWRCLTAEQKDMYLKQAKAAIAAMNKQEG